MPVIIDADSHLQPPLQWIEQAYPDAGLTREPSAFSPVKHFVPQEFWPDDEEQMYAKPWLNFLRVQREAIANGVSLDDMMNDPNVDLDAIHRLFRGRGAFDADERVEVLDEVGTDVQLVSGFGGFGIMGEGELRRMTIQTCNTLTCEKLEPHRDRLVAITDIDPTDLDWTIAEMERVRAMGSRVFNIPVEPVRGMSLSHPDFDRLWAAASDLGMLGYLHSFADPYDPGWANNGGNFLALSMLSAVRYHHQAELLATVMAGGGVFARFPKFGVIMAEIGGLAWVPNALGWMDALVCDPTMHAMEGVQEWKYELKPSEYCQRQLRVAPLPIESQHPAPWLELLGDIPVFSTDYPHPEGTPDPKVQGPEAASDFYRRDLAGVDERRRRRFMGESIGELFARTGDPLVAVS